MTRFVAFRIRIFLFVLCVSLSSLSAFGQTPPNDSCQSVIDISLGTGGFSIGTFQSDSINIDSATIQVGEYFHSSLISSGNDKKSIWYRFYIPARRGVNIELKQNANAIATKDVGFTTYLSNQCLPSGSDATNAKLTTLNQFGSSFHPCMDPGWYLVQVSAKARAMGKVYLEITTIYPHQYPAVVNAEYDDQDSAYNFGDQVVGKPGSQSGYIDYELGCYTINDSSEFFPDLGSNYLAYNQSAWFVFTANRDHDNTQLKWQHASGCVTTDTMAFRLFKGDCRGGGSLTLLDSSFSDWSANNTCYSNCSEIVSDYKCLFDSGEVYSVQVLYHKDNTKNMRFTIADQTAAYDSSNYQPSSSYARNVGTVSGNNSIYVGFGCGSYITDNVCGNTNYAPIRLGNLDYNLAQWVDFELDEQSRLSVQFTYGVNGNYKRYQNLAFRLFKDTVTSNCSDVDTSSIIVTQVGNGAYIMDCLEPGKYTIQLLGTDSLRDYSNWKCGGSMHLGGDYRLNLNQSELPVSNRFALTKIGEGDSINGMVDMPKYTTIVGQLDTVSCNEAVRPLDVCDTIHRKAMYRTFRIGDADNDGKADSGLLYIYNLQPAYRGYPYYDYNSWHRLYNGNATALRATQSISSYPDTLQGLTPFSDCLPQSSSAVSACLEPGEYTLVSFFDDDVIAYTEQPRFQFYSAQRKFNTYAKAEFLDSITNYTTVTGELDSFTCQTNPDTIDGVYCGRKNAYHVFYLDSQMVTTINIGYYAYYYGQSRFSLFSGDIRNGKSGLSLYNDGLDWSCTGYSRTTSDCNPLEPGWYTVIVSNDRDISYDSVNRVGDHRGLYTYPHNVTITTRASSITAPKYYRPSKAAFVDSLVNNNNALSYDTNYSGISGMFLNLAKFQFPMEVLECDLDTPLNHHPKSSLCDTNTTDIVYYTFTLAKDAYVRIWGNVTNGSWDMKLFDFDVRKDSAKLGTATPVQDCNYSANHLEFCNLQAGVYSIVYYCKRNAGSRATVNPVMHIDSVAYSRFDHAQNAYDFGTIPGNGVSYDGKIGDTHPNNSALPASHDMITCRTGAQRTDPTGMSCYNHVSPYVYAKDTNAGIYLYDSSYYRYSDNTTYYPWSYPVRRNIWYSFVVEGRGNVTVDLKGNVSSLIYPQINSMRFSIYESDEDGSMSLATLKSSGKIDSSYADGLTFVDRDYNYCYYGSDLSATFQISSCEKVKPRRYYVLVEPTNYYNNNQYPNVNHNVWLEIKYDSLYIPDTEFDFYSTANNINDKYGTNTVFAPQTLYTGDSTYFAGSTLDSTDYSRTYYYSSCSDPSVAGTVWYKFDVDSTGYLYYNYRYSYLSGGSTLLSSGYDQNRIRVYRSNTPGDSLSGLEYVPRISTSSKYYSLMNNGYASYLCVNPGTYYIQINKCNQHACSDYVYPQLAFDYHTGDFCETAMPLHLDTIAQTSARLLVNCHTIGTDFGEDGSDMGCLFGPKDYKSSWFVVDYTDTTKVDLEFKLGEYTDATAGEIRYRTFYGNCKSLTSGPCNNNALTTFTLDCIRKGTYYVQVVTPAGATGELEMSAEAKENTDTTCNPVDIFQPNAAFYYNTGCPENVINFVNTSSRGDSIRYFWDFGYNSLTDTVINPTVVYPPSSQEQQFTVKLLVEQIARGSKDSIEIVIDVPFAPSVDIINNDTNLCLGDSVTLTGIISHGDGIWSTGDSTTSITVRSTGMYFYEMLDKPQLLLNASFEEDVTTLGWTASNGTWTRSGSYNPRDSSYIGFASHTTAASTGILEMYQEIDVSFDSIEIDSGIAKTSFTGFVLGHNSYEDEAQVIVQYLDASNNLLGIYQSGLKNYGASWEYLEHSRTTPKNTRKIKVIVQTNKVNTTTRTSYSFFDHFVLKMRSACVYKDSVYVQINPYPTLVLPEDTTICPLDSFLVRPTITYDNPYVVQDSMNKTLSGSLKNSATHTASNGYVSLTSNTVNAENGQIEWEDSTLSIRDSFTVFFDFYSTGNDYYALWFYMFASTTPTTEDFASGGYSIAFDKNNSNQIQTEWNNGRLNTTASNINLDDGKWRSVKIVYNNQRFEIYIDNKLYVTYTDAGSRTQTGFKFGLGARSYYYNEYRVRNFHISKNNSELVVVTPVAERTYTYNWSDGNGDSTRYISPITTVNMRVIDKFGCASNYDTITIDKYPTRDSLFTSSENICSLLDSFQLTKPDSLGYFYGHIAVDSGGLVIVDSTSYGSNSVLFAVNDTNGCLLIDTGYFIVDSIPTFVFNPVDTLCNNDTLQQIVINHTDGYFYGGTYVDSAGWFDPSKTTQAVNVVYYRTNSTDCEAIDSIYIVVDSLPNAAITAAGPFCANSAVVTLAVTNAGGRFTPTVYLDTAGNFDPTLAGVGNHDAIYSLTNSNGCTASDTITIVVDSIPSAAIDSAGPFCANSAQLTLAVTNTGGRFTPTSYLDTVGQFDPSIAMAGSHKVFYSYTDGNGCSNTDSTIIVVDSIPDASFTTNPPYCENGPIDTLQPNVNAGGLFYGGSYVDSAGGFNPFVAKKGSHKVYYRYADGNGCIATDSATLQVDTITPITLNSSTPYCFGDTVQLITASPNNGGYFSGGSFIDSSGNFDPTSAGIGYHNIYFTQTNGLNCTTYASTVVYVDSLPDAGINAAGPFCANSVQTTLTVVNPGGRFTPTAYLDTAGQFDPSLAGAGSHTVYYTLTNANGCEATDSQVIVVDTIPSAAINAAGPFCANSVQVTLAVTNPGGRFTPTTYLDTAGQFDPSIATAGSHKIFYTFIDGNGCSNTDSSVVVVDTIPSAAINAAGPFCANSVPVTLAVTNPGGRFTPTTYLDTAGQFDPSIATAGNHKIFYTYTDGNGCSNTDSSVIVVDTIPSAAINAAGPFCANSVPVTLAVTNTGGRFTPTSYLDTAGQFDPSVAMAGSHKIFYSFTDGNGCSNTDSSVIVVDTIPSAAIDPAGPFCANSVPVTLAVTNPGGRFTPTTYLDTAGQFDPSIATAGNHKIFYTYTDGNGCSNTDSSVIVVDTIPSAAINAAGPFCANSVPVTLAVTNPGGRFTSTAYLDTAGQFDPSIAAAGNHKIFYTYTDGNGCSNTDSSVIVVDTIPSAAIDPAGPFCANSVPVALAVTNAGGRFTPTSYLDTAGQFDPSVAMAGSHKIFYTFTDGNGCSAIDSSIIVVDSIPDAMFTSNSPYCENGSIDTLTAVLNAGGRFYGGAYIDSAGGFNPVVAKKGSHKVYYTFTDGNGCIAVDSATIQVDTITPVTINTNTPYCLNDTVQVLTANPNSGGFFSGGVFIDSTGNFNPTIAGVGAHNINFTQTNGLNCVTYASTVVIVDSIPDASINATMPQCENAGVVTITGVYSGGVFIKTAYLDTAGNFDPSIAKAGSHQVIYSRTDGKGCTGRDTILVVVDSVPSAAIAQAGPFCENAGIKTLAARYNAGGKFGPLPYMDSAGNFDPLIAGDGIHKVYYTFTDGNGCTGNDSITVVVDTLPQATINPAGPYCANGGVEKITTVTAGGLFTATSYMDTSGNFDPVLAGVGSFKIYYTLDDGAGCMNTDSTIVVVDSIPSAAIDPAGPFCANSVRVTLAVTNPGGRFTPTAYLDTAGQFDPSIATAGNHKVFYTFSDGNGCSNVDSTVIAVDTIPSAAIDPTGPFCANSVQVTLAVTNPGGRFTPTSYIDTAGQFDPSIATAGSHKVFYSLTDGNGCSNTDSIIIVVDTLPDAGILPAGPFCANSVRVTLAVTNSGGRFTPTAYLDTAGQFDPVVAMAGSHKAVYTLTDGNGCTASDSTTILVDTIPSAAIDPAGPFCANSASVTLAVVNPGGRFTPTAYIDTVGQFDPSIAMAGSHRIYYSFTDGNGCSNVDSSVIAVDTIPTASIDPAGPFCANSVRTTLTVTNPGGRFTPTAYLDTIGNFDPNIALAGNHKVYYTFNDGNGCSNTDSTIVVVNALSNPGITPSGLHCAHAAPVQINPITSGGTFSGGSYVNATGLFDPGQAVIGQNKVVYTITNADGCTSKDSINVEVLAIPTNTITLNPHEGCEPLGVFVSSERTGGEDSVVWFVNGTRTTDMYNFFGTYTRGTYQVRLNVYAMNGCDIQKDTSFEVFPKPVADFTYSPTDIYISDPTVQFTDRSTANVVAWNWDFGDATNSADEDPRHTYADAGEYLVQLFVTSDKGCLDTTSQTLIIKDEILLFIPNAISPNDDGLNDVFRVVGLGYTNIDILIFNRWGEQIYQSDNFIQWDGTYKGEKVQMGSYPYIMNIVDNRGRKYHEVGEVQVVR